MSEDDNHRTQDLPIGEWMTQLTTQEAPDTVAVFTSDEKSAGGRREEMESSDEPTDVLLSDETVRVPRPDLHERIGPYEVIDRLGIGGMAEVFVARDSAGHQVVIKRSLPHLRENPRFVEMFLREARIAERLDHPNIVHVYALGEDRGNHFIAMEHVEGLTLQRLARRAWHNETSVPMDVVLRVIADVAAGLAYAHELRGSAGESLGLVHRDISPDNLMVNRNGVSKVLDFGIAKASDTQSLTKSGEIKGKVPFMSPEQVRGDPLDHRTDLYALGVCLHWLLTGRRPFVAASDFLTMRAVLEHAPSPPSQLNPQVPPALDAVVLRLLEKEADRRYQSGHALVDALVEMLPPSRRETVELVRQALTWPDPPAGDLSMGGSFIAATPSAARLRGGGYSPDVDTAPARPDDDVPRTRTHTATAQIDGNRSRNLALSGAGLLAIAAVATVGVITDKRAPEQTAATPTIVMAAHATDTRPAPVAPSPAPEPPAPATAALSTVLPEAPAAVMTAPPTDRSRAPPVATKSVLVRGPATVRWRHGGRTLTRGNGKVSVPKRVRQLTALSSARGHEARVDIKGGRADYGALATGTVEFRVFPYAEVSLGTTSLGVTPMTLPPLAVGRYRATLRYNGQAYSTTFTVRAGEKTIVKKSFDGP